MIFALTGIDRICKRRSDARAHETALRFVFAFSKRKSPKTKSQNNELRRNRLAI